MTNHLDALNATYGKDTPGATVIYDGTCYKCDGAGRIACYGHVDGGMCYHCDGCRTCQKPCCYRTLDSLRKAARRLDRKEAKAQAEFEAKTADRTAWNDEHADLVSVWNELSERNDFLAELAAEQVRIPTDRQLDAAAKTVERLTHPVEVEPLEAGRYLITGTIIAHKFVPGFAYNSPDVCKITVKLAGGQRVFGTVPKAIAGEVYDEWVEGRTFGSVPGCWAEGLRGREVMMTATIIPSNDEPSFGFFKRPTCKK